MSDGLVDAMIRALSLEGVDLGALGLAWARVTPTVTIVPAFGLRAMPAPGRAVMAVALAACIAPGLRPIVTSETWAVALLAELGRGVPLALATAAPLWAATMAGGLVDALRGAGEGPSLPVVDDRAPPLASLFSMVASLAFLASGGPARVATAALDATSAGIGTLAHAAVTLSSGIGLATAIAAPMIAGAVVVEVALALLARSAAPTNMQATIALGRGVAVLALLAILFERIAAGLTLLGTRSV